MQKLEIMDHFHISCEGQNERYLGLPVHIINSILSIPIKEGFDDLSAWHPDPKGNFLVRSAYKLKLKLVDVARSNINFHCSRSNNKHCKGLDQALEFENA